MFLANEPQRHFRLTDTERSSLRMEYVVAAAAVATNDAASSLLPIIDLWILMPVYNTSAIRLSRAVRSVSQQRRLTHEEAVEAQQAWQREQAAGNEAVSVNAESLAHHSRAQQHDYDYRVRLVLVDDGSDVEETRNALQDIVKHTGDDKNSATDGDASLWLPVDAVELITRPSNGGVAKALNDGLDFIHAWYRSLPSTTSDDLSCQHKRSKALLFRADSDDSYESTRLHAQALFLSLHPHVDVLGTAVNCIRSSQDAATESSERAAAASLPSQTTQQRCIQFPLRHAGIVWAFNFYCPLAHPSICFRLSSFHTRMDTARNSHRERASFLLEYPEHPAVQQCEDLQLWLLVAEAGCCFANLSQPLITLNLSPSSAAHVSDGSIISSTSGASPRRPRQAHQAAHAHQNSLQRRLQQSVPFPLMLALLSPAQHLRDLSATVGLLLAIEVDVCHRLEPLCMIDRARIVEDCSKRFAELLALAASSKPSSTTAATLESIETNTMQQRDASLLCRDDEPACVCAQQVGNALLQFTCVDLPLDAPALWRLWMKRSPSTALLRSMMLLSR